MMITVAVEPVNVETVRIIVFGRDEDTNYNYVIDIMEGERDNNLARFAAQRITDLNVLENEIVFSGIHDDVDFGKKRIFASKLLHLIRTVKSEEEI